MKISFLIVTKNRPEALEFTLQKLQALINMSLHEVRVFIDDCPLTEALIPKFNWVIWQVSNKSLSASPAREKLYKQAKGELLIGLDDDAHIISSDFITTIEHLFETNQKLGIVAFQEIKGIFSSDEIALANAQHKTEAYFTTDFVGCGFAIKKSVYFITNGFPKWVDIYGEESCLSIEVLQADFDILYYPEIIVNHRVDLVKRASQGRNYFRFEKQLKNTFNYYLVYHSNPLRKITKLMHHNFKKYALQDFRYFKLYFKSFFQVLYTLPVILRYRKPVSKTTLLKMKNLKGLRY